MSLRSLLSLVCLLFLLPSCVEDEVSRLPVTGIDAEELVEQYNQQLGPLAADTERAFSLVGSVNEVGVEKDASGEELLTFTFSAADRVDRTFHVGLLDDVAFPPAINRAKVVYLGRQLIVADLDGDFYVHLLIPDEGFENLIPGLPYAEGSGLTYAVLGAS